MGRWMEAEFPESLSWLTGTLQSQGLAEQHQCWWRQLGRRIDSADPGGAAALPLLSHCQCPAAEFGQWGLEFAASVFGFPAWDAL